MLIELRRQVLYVMHNSQPQLRMREFLPRDDLRKHRPCFGKMSARLSVTCYIVLCLKLVRAMHTRRAVITVTTPLQFLYTKHYGNISTPPPTGEWNAVDMKQEVKVI